MKTAASKLMLDQMIQLWEYMEDIKKDATKKVEHRTLRETDRLILYATGKLFDSYLRDFRKANSVISKDLQNVNEDTFWNTTEERIYRFLHRSYYSLRKFVRLYQGIISKPYQTLISAIGKHLRRVEEMAITIFLDGVQRPPSDTWTCRRHRRSIACSSEDHFHTFDDLVWPSHEADLEKGLPQPSRPEITFRCSGFRLLSKDEAAITSVQSAIEAVKGSWHFQHKQELFLEAPDSSFRLAAAVRDRKSLPEVLARIGAEIVASIRRHG